MAKATYDFGMIGLGVMGRNLLLNIADHGYAAIGFDKDISKGKLLEKAAGKDTVVKGVSSLADMVGKMRRPRRVMMLVPAGKPVDDVISDLLPLLEEGDIVIDGGNSHFKDTLRRVNELRDKKIHFMGMGVSGGEEGARHGPSMMPGGDREAFAAVQPILEAIAAKVGKDPCVAYMGKGAAGHYVKMVHNGIEYAIMQLISEVYDLMRQGLNLSNDDMHTLFRKWNQEELQSFLVEITADIFMQDDDQTGNRLLDMILDKAGSKGTGKWTSQEAMDLPVSLPTIDMAVAMRDLSGYKEERIEAEALYKHQVLAIPLPPEVFTAQLKDALYFSTMVAYAQGLAMLQKASAEWKMDISLDDVVKIWRGGCIIRSSLLDIFYGAYRKNPGLKNILLDETISQMMHEREQNTRSAVINAVSSRIPLNAMMSALGYFDAWCRGRMSTNLIQAQRDYFGAHTYERTDRPGSFHTEWQKHAG